MLLGTGRWASGLPLLLLSLAILCSGAKGWSRGPRLVRHRIQCGLSRAGPSGDEDVFRRVALHGLPWDTTKADIEDAFASFGPLRRVELSAGPCVLRGSCMLDFEHQADASLALAAAVEVRGRVVHAEYPPAVDPAVSSSSSSSPSKGLELHSREELLARAARALPTTPRALVIKCLEHATTLAPLETLEEFHQAMNALLRVGEGRRVVALHHEILESRSISASRLTFDLALAGAAVAASVPTAKDMLQEMVDVGLNPDTTAYLSAIQAATRSHDCGEAVGLLDEMKQQGMQADEYCYTAALKACDGQGHCEAASRLVDDLEAQGVDLADAGWNAAIEACEIDENWGSVLQFSAKKHHLDPSSGGGRTSPERVQVEGADGAGDGSARGGV
uniref:RRM domain-containing protein n=1 Tax=Rhizochromulina marina TaxID=1034831 RepID=A0A7S2RBQ9_9STRA|mmetsp:Transcript_13941/g.40846  ORF Transcript_13941/g.40846 Transcript_13941/m.40846 type:complete len:390 (-) Transcript_13941:77-1246(-)